MDPFSEVIGQYCLPPAAIVASREEEMEDTDVIVPDEKDFENEQRARMQSMRLSQFHCRQHSTVIYQ